MSPKARNALTTGLVLAAAVAGFLAGCSPSRRGLLAAPHADGPDVAEFRGWALPAATVEKELSAQRRA